jgi:hypothetical protein
VAGCTVWDSRLRREALVERGAQLRVCFVDTTKGIGTRMAKHAMEVLVAGWDDSHVGVRGWLVKGVRAIVERAAGLYLAWDRPLSAWDDVHVALLNEDVMVPGDFACRDESITEAWHD